MCVACPVLIRGSPPRLSEVWRMGGLEKGYLHNIVRNFLSNSRHICDTLAQPSSDVRNELPAILRKFGAQFATKVAQRPPRERPLLGISAKTPSDCRSGPKKDVHEKKLRSRKLRADFSFPKNGSKWSILVPFGFSNAKIQFGIRSF